MAVSLFYSWQSDLPANTTRDFIRRALETAVKAVNTSIEIEDVMRVTSDTEDVPGHPPIFETILEKIEACSVFTPDLSIITKLEGRSGKTKGLFNPNVAIEYGYALKALGPSRIIPVMNTAYGGLDKLPFDMAHRRGPIRFHLRENATNETVEKQNYELIEKLICALTAMREHDLIGGGDTASPPSFTPIAPYEGANANNRPFSLLGHINPDRASEEGDAKVWLREGPRLLLRLIPTNPSRELNPLSLLDKIRKAQMASLMGDRTTGASYQSRNETGAASFTIKSQEPDASGNCYAFGFTQVLTNGEIWGEDTWLLNESHSQIASHALEKGMIEALSSYLGFARDYLEINTSLRWVAGMYGIRDHRLALPLSQVSGPTYNDTVFATGIIEQFTPPTSEILKPFFEKVWEEFGIQRPPEMDEK